MNASWLSILSLICLVLGFLSIFASIAVWFVKKGDTAESKAYAERLGLFVGLWVPAFFALAIYFKLIAMG